jgi:hypothetical protein
VGKIKNMTLVGWKFACLSISGRHIGAPYLSHYFLEKRKRRQKPNEKLSKCTNARDSV